MHKSVCLACTRSTPVTASVTVCSTCRRRNRADDGTTAWHAGKLLLLQMRCERSRLDARVHFEEGVAAVSAAQLAGSDEELNGRGAHAAARPPQPHLRGAVGMPSRRLAF